jgi:excisionase family DNA binding protein
LGSNGAHWVLNPTRRALDVPATAEYLGVKRRTVFRLMESGELRPVRLPGVRRLLFDKHDLDALIEKAKQ